MICSQFSTKILKANFASSLLANNDLSLEQRETLFEKEKVNCQPCSFAMPMFMFIG